MLNNSPYPPDWLVPDWEAPPWVRSVFSSRSGGVSEGPYGSMNLGDHVGDLPSAVHLNRQLFANALQARPVFLSQVHGVSTLDLLASTPDGQLADAAVSQSKGVACTVMVADCLPVLFAHRQVPLVAAAHAGWRGLAGAQGAGVLESAVRRLVELAGQASDNGADVVAWMGPCIGPTAFEVGDEVRAVFVLTHPQAADCFEPRCPGKWLANLPALARIRLQGLGLTAIAGNDGSEGWCTVRQASRFFSYRRDSRAGIGTGRMAASVWLV